VKETISYNKYPVNPVYPVKNIKITKRSHLSSAQSGARKSKQTQNIAISIKEQGLLKKQTQIGTPQP
jgi:anti-sigma28 factor (negative regulator of flagellin synthesis)